MLIIYSKNKHQTFHFHGNNFPFLSSAQSSYFYTVWERTLVGSLTLFLIFSSNSNLSLLGVRHLPLHQVPRPFATTQQQEHKIENSQSRYLSTFRVLPFCRCSLIFNFQVQKVVLMQ